MRSHARETSLELRSLITDAGALELSLAEVAVPVPSDDQVLVRMEAAPINPSDLMQMFAGADLVSLQFSGTADRPVITAPLAEDVLARLAGRIGTSMPVGTEGAGTVVAAGEGTAAQLLLGRTVAVAGSGMFAQYRVADASGCVVLPEGMAAKEGASSFANPLTALCMLTTLRREGHTGLVHTAAASSLGQVLVKLCREEDVPLVSIVRKPEQAELLRSIGATFVCDTSAPTFTDDLATALRETSATLAFDATGGGTLASQLLNAMEAVAVSTGPFSGYGSSTHKQVYIFGGLDPSPMVLTRRYGFSWSIGGWLLVPFLMNLAAEDIQEMLARVVAGLTTTFASSYCGELSLAGALTPEAIRAYAKRATGEKYLITPQGDR